VGSGNEKNAVLISPEGRNVLDFRTNQFNSKNLT
jgi:hypothetical protein